MILEAAGREFAAVGPAGARTDAIAAAAGVNKRMLYHYFGSKERLYETVLATRLADYVGEAPAALLGDQLNRRAADARERGDDVRLLMWEALTRSAPSVAANAARSATWRARVANLGAAQRAGAIAADVDAAQLELALAALTIFPFAFRQIAVMVTGGTPGEPAFDTAHATFLAALANRLATPPRRRDASKPRVRLTAATISRAD